MNYFYLYLSTTRKKQKIVYLNSLHSVCVLLQYNWKLPLKAFNINKHVPVLHHRHRRIGNVPRTFVPSNLNFSETKNNTTNVSYHYSTKSYWSYLVRAEDNIIGCQKEISIGYNNSSRVYPFVPLKCASLMLEIIKPNGASFFILLQRSKRKTVSNAIWKF